MRPSCPVVVPSATTGESSLTARHAQLTLQARVGNSSMYKRSDSASDVSCSVPAKHVFQPVAALRLAINSLSSPRAQVSSSSLFGTPLHTRTMCNTTSSTAVILAYSIINKATVLLQRGGAVNTAFLSLVPCCWGLALDGYPSWPCL